ncbi:hypothetical protein NC651_025521 [Populus alba x Populus x berolinensis]|nr:hypothetical protein NC651_025521 [Populus alba x Populus x berolinensis]
MAMLVISTVSISHPFPRRDHHFLLARACQLTPHHCPLALCVGDQSPSPMTIPYRASNSYQL